MNKKILKKFGIALLAAAGSLYIIFLALPLIVNPIVNGYTPQIEAEINKATGLVSRLDGVRLVTTPKLTAGLGINKFTLTEQDNMPFFSADDFRIKMSLIPLLAGRIEIDTVQLKNADAHIKINKDGSLDALQNMPQSEQTKTPVELPLKFSNRLPDIRIEKYNINLTDGRDNYVFSGDCTEITDFILNKHVKVKASGKAVFKGKEQLKYSLKLYNKIMPEIELNELVTNPPQTGDSQNSEPIDIIAVLDGLYKNKFTLNTEADLVITRNSINGYADVTNLSIIGLPPSNAHLKFKGENIDIRSDIYTAQNELSKINGNIKTGKHPNIDLYFKSKAELSNIVKIIKETALIFNIKDLQTISAAGKIDADFNIKSDLKKVKSNGYLKIPSAKLYYGLYKIGVNDINADIKLDNNNVNINNIGFSILNHPLKFYGTIKESGNCDLHLTAQQLNIKGLLLALGQTALLKDNNIKNGTAGVNADITGRLNKINPVIKINLDNLNINNIPSNTSLKIPLANLNIAGQTFTGCAESSNIMIANPAATVSIPKIKLNIGKENIEITQTPVSINKINTTISGMIKNYLQEKINLDFTSTGDIKSTLAGNLNVAKQTMDLLYSTTAQSTIIIPGFDKSNMTFSGNVGISGSFINPVLKGNIDVPALSIPEIPVNMTDLNIKLNGHVLNGHASLAKFASGGIEAENITSDFSLKGNDFYLNNLKGTAFDGKIGGNIIYNLTNAGTEIVFTGENMNAEKAVSGAAGIKNALSGTLNFNTKLSLTVADYNEMMHSMKGALNFSVKDGAFGTIGRIENLLQADNIVNNTLLKSTVTAITKAIGIADTAKFSYINGELAFSDGWAELKPVKSSGPLLAYYIKGKYNLINANTILTILGRLDATVVAKLGPLGDLSASKLLGYIPKFGTNTVSAINALPVQRMKILTLFRYFQAEVRVIKILKSSTTEF